jgi:uncharacterized protein (DUF433 family)
MVATAQNLDLIVSDPEVRKGRPFIAGTGIRVMDIAAAMLFHDQTPGEIADAYDLSLAQVHAALAHYYAHKDEIDQDLREQIARARELKDKRVGSKPPFLFG